MKLKDWVAIMNGIDEFNIYNGNIYFQDTKDLLLARHGEDEIDEIFIKTFEEGSWVMADIFLK